MAFGKQLLAYVGDLVILALALPRRDVRPSERPAHRSRAHRTDLYPHHNSFINLRVDTQLDIDEH